MFWSLFFAGVAALPSNTTTIIQNFWETVFLYSPGLKEHIPVFIIIFRPKLQELRGIEVAPPLSTGAKTYQLYYRMPALGTSGDNPESVSS
jgi:hypothetical protein